MKDYSISFSRVRKTAMIYMALPLFCYLCGFLRWYWSLISCAALLFVLWQMLKDKGNLESTFEEPFSYSLQTVVIVFLFTLFWTWLGGLNGYFYQSSDWDCRNAVFFDLIRYDWPVIYDRSGAALVYYVGHWLPPAAIAKAVLTATGSIEISREAGRMLLWFWTSAGLSIVMLMIFRAVNAQTRRKRIASAFLFVFFSGMDLIGAIINNKLSELMSPDILHLEWWVYGMEYTSTMSSVFWVFNQTVIPWMIILCFFVEKDPKNYVFYGTVCLLCGTLPCFGLVVLMLVKAAVYLFKCRRERKGKQAAQNIFSVRNLVSFLALFPLVAAFLLSANTFKDAFGSSLDLIGMNAARAEQAEYRQEEIDPNATTETEQSVKPKEQKKKGLLSGNRLDIKLFVFLALEVGFFLLFIWPDHRKNPLFYIIAVSLIFIPCIRIGKGNDFCMRASVPGIFILMLYVNRFLLEHFPRKGKKLLQKKERTRRAAAIALAICFAIGMATPIVEVYRGVYHVVDKGTFFLEDQRLMTFNQDWIQNSYACSNPDEHLFFKYFSR